jgi:hypothetical protein
MGLASLGEADRADAGDALLASSSEDCGAACEGCAEDCGAACEGCAEDCGAACGGSMVMPAAAREALISAREAATAAAASSAEARSWPVGRPGGCTRAVGETDEDLWPCGLCQLCSAAAAAGLALSLVMPCHSEGEEDAPRAEPSKWLCRRWDRGEESPTDPSAARLRGVTDFGDVDAILALPAEPGCGWP